jgi:hypothetical protein
MEISKSVSSGGKKLCSKLKSSGTEQTDELAATSELTRDARRGAMPMPYDGHTITGEFDPLLQRTVVSV